MCDTRIFELIQQLLRETYVNCSNPIWTDRKSYITYEEAWSTFRNVQAGVHVLGPLSYLLYTTRDLLPTRLITTQRQQHSWVTPAVSTQMVKLGDI